MARRQEKEKEQTKKEIKYETKHTTVLKTKERCGNKILSEATELIATIGVSQPTGQRKEITF